MKYSVKEQSDIQSIVVRASGIINTTLAEDMVMEAGRAIKISGFTRCLFDLIETEVDPNQSMTEMFLFIDVFNKAGISKSTKIAALYTTGGEYRLQLDEGAKFAEFKFKHFTDQEEALDWLCQ